MADIPSTTYGASLLAHGWKMGDGSVPQIAVNPLDGADPYKAEPDDGGHAQLVLFETPGALQGLREGVPGGDSLVALLLPCACAQAGQSQTGVA